MSTITTIEAIFAVLIIIAWGANYYLSRELRKLADLLLEITRTLVK